MRIQAAPKEGTEYGKAKIPAFAGAGRDSRQAFTRPGLVRVQNQVLL